MLLYSTLLLLLCGFIHAQVTCPDVNHAHTNGCSCTANIIDCTERNLTSIPLFRTDSFYEELRLHDNFITTITDHAFASLQNLKRLYIGSNQINSIHNNAFQTVDSKLQIVDLSYNNLTRLPQALGNLGKLLELNVAFNHINENGFDEAVMFYLGDTLVRFDFGSHDIRSWPPTLRHLQALEYLNVTQGEFLTLPPDAFHGFEGTLLLLSMQNTKLIALPLALANLRYLETLYFDHNHDLGDSGVLIPSFGSTPLLIHLRTVSLVDDGLTVFPSLLRYLTHVETLVLDSNRLAFVSDASVELAVGTQIRNLSLSNCSLSRVPGALSKLTNLQTLNLAKNNIHSFENSDFDGLTHLMSLDITGNPLEYIANETFKDLNLLSTLNLQDTKIKTMPEAIRFLRSLHTLKLPDNAIECTCEIVWLKVFTDKCNHNLDITGSCETIIASIQDYLQQHIPNCPNYNPNVGCR